MSITYSASGISAGTKVATCMLSDNSHAQMVVMVDSDGNLVGGAASPLWMQAASVIPVSGSSIQSGAWTVTASLVTPASSIQSGAWFVGASVLNSPSMVVSSGSVVVTSLPAASAIQSGLWSVSASIVNSPSVVVSSLPAASAIQTGAWAVSASVVNAASVVVTNQVSASISNAITASAIQTGAWSVSASVVNAASVVVTNQVSASISGSVALLPGANVIGSASVIQSGAWAVSVTSQAGSAAGSPLFVSLTNSTGSVLVANSTGSMLVTNLAGSAAGSPLFSSITNQVSASISNALTASAIQGTPAALAGAWPVKLTDGVSGMGVPGSPLVVALESNRVWWSGSPLAVRSANLSASAACTIVIPGTGGQAIVIVAATFTTSGSQRVGWLSGSAASALVQTPMPFATHGGMDAQRLPHGHLWSFGSGCAAVVTTSAPCDLAGTLNYLLVAS